VAVTRIHESIEDHLEQLALPSREDA
jgi:hypothetical protein